MANKILESHLFSEQQSKLRSVIKISSKETHHQANNKLRTCIKVKLTRHY